SNLYELVKARAIVAYPDADVRLAISRAIAIETGRGWRITKEKQSHKIDIVVALAMAAHAAGYGSREPEVSLSMPIVAGAPRAARPGGYSFGSDACVAPTIGALTAQPPAPPAPVAPAAAPGQSWTGPKDGPYPWLKKPAPVTQRVNGGPPQTVSGDEARARMQRVNADKSLEYKIMDPHQL